MKYYIADCLEPDMDYGVTYVAKDEEDAKRIAHFKGWEYVGHLEDVLSEEQIAMMEGETHTLQ